MIKTSFGDFYIAARMPSGNNIAHYESAKNDILQLNIIIYYKYL